MMTIKRILMILASAALLCACGKDHSYEDDTDAELAVYQITGTWKLESWSNGEIPDGIYGYMVLSSKDNEFELYQNFGSPYSRHLTGNFTLTYDEAAGRNVISGWYDYDSGFWASDYIITDVTADTMKWISTGTTSGPQSASGPQTVSSPGSADFCIYRRCDSVPADILAGTRSR